MVPAQSQWSGLVHRSNGGTGFELRRIRLSTADGAVNEVGTVHIYGPQGGRGTEFGQGNEWVGLDGTSLLLFPSDLRFGPINYRFGDPGGHFVFLTHDRFRKAWIAGQPSCLLDMRRYRLTATLK